MRWPLWLGIALVALACEQERPGLSLRIGDGGRSGSGGTRPEFDLDELPFPEGGSAGASPLDVPGCFWWMAEHIVVEDLRFEPTGLRTFASGSLATTFPNLESFESFWDGWWVAQVENSTSASVYRLSGWVEETSTLNWVVGLQTAGGAIRETMPHPAFTVQRSDGAVEFATVPGSVVQARPLLPASLGIENWVTRSTGGTIAAAALAQGKLLFTEVPEGAAESGEIVEIPTVLSIAQLSSLLDDEKLFHLFLQTTSGEVHQLSFDPKAPADVVERLLPNADLVRAERVWQDVQIWWQEGNEVSVGRVSNLSAFTRDDLTPSRVVDGLQPGWALREEVGGWIALGPRGMLNDQLRMFWTDLHGKVLLDETIWETTQGRIVQASSMPALDESREQYVVWVERFEEEGAEPWDVVYANRLGCWLK